MHKRSANTLTQADVQLARTMACLFHSRDWYGAKPYIAHLDDVASLVPRDDIFSQVAAYLHDTGEHVGSAAKLWALSQYGKDMAFTLALLTDPYGGNRKLRKSIRYARLERFGDRWPSSLIVSAADRLSNVRQCKSTHRLGLLGMYASEHERFRSACYRPGICDPLWALLDEEMRHA